MPKHGLLPRNQPGNISTICSANLDNRYRKNKSYRFKPNIRRGNRPCEIDEGGWKATLPVASISARELVWKPGYHFLR
jgi:hypothetical protein